MVIDLFVFDMEGANQVLRIQWFDQNCGSSAV